MITLESCEIFGFRGLRQLRLSFEQGKALLLHGLNGTGKSSFHQALCFAITGAFPPVSDLPDAPSAAVFRHVALDPATAAYVHITFSDGTNSHWLRRELAATGMVTVSSSLGAEQLLSSSVNGLCFLTRRQFASMVDAVEKESWSRLTPFLGHQELADYREGLRSLANYLRRDLALSVLQQQQTQARNLRAETEARKKELQQRLGWEQVSSQAVQDETTRVCGRPVTVESLDSVNWDNLESQLPASVRARDIASLLQSLSEEQTLVGMQGVDAKKLEVALDFCSKMLDEPNLIHDLAHAEFLATSSNTVRKLSTEPCPLCGLGPPDWDKVRAELAARSASLNEARAQLTVATSAIANYAAAVTGVRERLEMWASTHPVRPQLTGFLESIRKFAALVHVVHEGLAASPPRGRTFEELEAVQSARKETAASFKILSDALKSSQEQLLKEQEGLAGAAELKRLMLVKAAVGAHLDFQKADRDYRRITSQVVEAERIVQSVQRLFAQVDAAEADLSATVVQDLATEVRRVFGILTDGGQLAPTIRTKTERGVRMAEIIIEDFYGLGPVPARDYLSEANRNSLGLAIYFAGLLRRNPNLKVLVIDDITHSADNAHRRGLAEFIAQELSPSLQLIVLTHDDHWHARLKQTISPDRWVEVQVINWSPDGLTLRSDTWKTLFQKAADQIQRVESFGGNALRQALEQFVDDACERYDVLFPYRKSPNSISLNDKRQRLENKIRDVWSTGNGMIDPTSAPIRLLLLSQQITNLGSHHGSFESWVHQDLLDALKDVADIVDAFTCKNIRGASPCGGILPDLKKQNGVAPTCKRCGQPTTL